jgi:hypothetical protein
MITTLLFASAAGVAARAQSITLDKVAKQVSTITLANNASILMLDDIECLTQAARDGGGLKSQINTYAAVGERQVGRENFRKLFFGDLVVHRQALRTVGPVAWCERVTVQLQAQGVAVPITAAAD